MKIWEGSAAKKSKIKDPRQTTLEDFGVVWRRWAWREPEAAGIPIAKS